VLKLIELAAAAAHRHGKWIGVCGGLASDLKAVPILLGLGIDELSVSIPSVALVKSTVRESSLNETSTLALKALAQQSAKDVRELKTSTPSNQGPTNVGDEKLVFLPAEDR
jgi:phosphoenolpyruvate-protein kinase (PTS system EI component)